MHVKKIRQVISGVMLFAAFTYGLGSFFGWWDVISGRTAASTALMQLATSEGWPSIVIRTNDPLFPPTEQIIERYSKNPEVRSYGRKPSAIGRFGDKQFNVDTRNMPPNWPASVTAPKWAYIVFFYGDIEKPGVLIVQVGTLGDLEQWIERSKSRENFWATVVAATVLSLSIFLLELTENNAQKIA